MNTVSRFFAVLVCFSSSLAAVQDDDFWLMLTAPAESSFSISSFTDNQQQLLLSLQLDQKLHEQLHINAAWSQYDNNNNIRSSSLGFSGDPYSNYLWFYNFKQWGETSSIQSRDHEIRLQAYAGKWYGLLGVQSGDVSINFVRNLRNRQTSASSNHQAVITGLGYSHKDFYWQFENIRHQYQKDLSQLASSRFLSRLIEPTALQQSTSLNKSSRQLSLGFNIDDYTISTQFSRLTSVVTQSSSDFINLSLTLPLDINQQLSLHISSPLQTGTKSIGLSFLQRW